MVPMYCSIIIPTVGRSSLTRAVESVLQQRLPEEDFEVIVVNDSGKPLPEADWQTFEQVQVINTNKRERSVARNTGAAAAKGKYLHFLDDDDWVMPGAYQYLWKLSRTSNAKWLYGITQLVNRQEEPQIRLRHSLNGNCFVYVMSGEWIPLQSSWIERKTFMKVGGFNPLLAGPEDIDLLRRIVLEDEVAETPNLISQVIMGGEGTTTDYAHHSEASRWAREHILNAAGVQARMAASASSPSWKGRIFRVYMTSVVWNLKQRQFFTAMSRMYFSFLSLFQSGRSLFSKQFWSAVTKPYASLTFERGFQEVQKEG
jgi:glycosyltransferase involved in cell wall biosynthesis